MNKCATCDKAATCIGVYEDCNGPEAHSCDACCGHGNEDGHCRPVGVLSEIDELIEYVEQDVGVIYSGPDIPELTGKSETIESLREIRVAVEGMGQMLDSMTDQHNRACQREAEQEKRAIYLDEHYGGLQRDKDLLVEERNQWADRAKAAWQERDSLRRQLDAMTAERESA